MSAPARRARGRLGAVLLGGLVCGPGAAAARTEVETPAPWFESVGDEIGLDFVHQRAGRERFWFPEIMSGGAAWLDYDGDGDLDLYLVQGGELDPAGGPGPGNRLLRNDGGRFADVTAAAGVGDAGYGMGAAVGDYDGDGAVDLYVTNVGPNLLYRNRGDGRFAAVDAGVGDPGWGSSAAFTDYDGDGDLDLFVVNYVHWSPANEIECFSGGARDYCHPNRYNAPARDRLYRNDGGTFTEVSAEAGTAAAFGNGLGVAPLDFDGDGRPDLFVANDGMPNQLWINRGDGRFEDRALVSGCAVNMAGAAEAGMGVAVGDVDGDGHSDLLLTHLRQETNTLYLNRGGYCEDATARSGLAAPSINRTGFGVVLADFDHDARLDLLVVNGRVGGAEAPLTPADPYAEPDQVFRGRAAGRFEELAGAFEGSPIENGRAAAVGDFDLDGDLDVVVVNNGGPARLLRNRAAAAGWVGFRVLDAAGAPALGARVELATPGGRQSRLVESAYSYCSANDPTAHFGLGGEPRVTAAEVRWPDGRRRLHRELPAGRSFTVAPAPVVYNRGS